MLDGYDSMSYLSALLIESVPGLTSTLKAVELVITPLLFQGSDRMLVEPAKSRLWCAQTLYLSDLGNRYYVTAAPQCVYPDAYLGTVLNSVALDAVYVQVSLCLPPPRSSESFLVQCEYRVLERLTHFLTEPFLGRLSQV